MPWQWPWVRAAPPSPGPMPTPMRGATSRARMQGGEGDPILAELANHLVLAAHGEGEIGQPALLGANLRDTSISYTALSRAVTIISSSVAQMVSGGGLVVRDRDDNVVDNRRTQRAINLLSHSPDGGVMSAYQFIEDVVADYCLDGNALIVPMTMPDGSVYELVRFRPHSAYTKRNNDGPLVYYAQRAFTTDGMLEVIAARNMIHVRWPQLRRGWLGEHQREHFAIPNVTLLQRQLAIGRHQDTQTERWYRQGPKSGIHFNYDNQEQIAAMGAENFRQLADRIYTDAKMGKDLYVTFGTQGAYIDTTPRDLEHRGYGVQEIARFFGLPLPLFSTPIGQWTRGINEQIMKLAWRTGIRPHVDRLLAGLNARLLMPGERFVVDPSEFVRGDAQGIAELAMAWQGDAQRDPVASREELRHLGGLPRQPDGDIASTRQERADGGMDMGRMGGES